MFLICFVQDTGKRDIDCYTKDGSLDRHGKPAIKGKTGDWKSVRLLLGICFLIQFFLGLSV